MVGQIPLLVPSHLRQPSVRTRQDPNCARRAKRMEVGKFDQKSELIAEFEVLRQIVSARAQRRV